MPAWQGAGWFGHATLQQGHFTTSSYKHWLDLYNAVPPRTLIEVVRTVCVCVCDCTRSASWPCCSLRVVGSFPPSLRVAGSCSTGRGQLRAAQVRIHDDQRPELAHASVSVAVTDRRSSQCISETHLTCSIPVQHLLYQNTLSWPSPSMCVVM